MAICSSEGEKVLLVFLLLLFAGCNAQNKATNDNYLLRIGNMVVTDRDYLDAFEVMKASYPYEALKDAQVEKILKTRLLKQMTEELILSKRAEELGLSVSADEVEKAVMAFKKNYPDGAFETMLMERAITYDAWEKRVKMRLLMEKVIDKELVALVKLTPEEVNAFYRESYPEDGTKENHPEKIDADFVKQLRREKAQKQYPQWIDTLQKQYNIELNERRWNTIFD